jgi:GT2 family glycosyltransferase
MIVTRELLDRIGDYDEGMGPGAPVPIGEDIDLIYRAARNKVKILFVPDIVIYHDHGRDTDDAFVATYRLYSKGRGVYLAKHVLFGDRFALKMAYWTLAQWLKDFFKNLRHPAKIKLSLHYITSFFIGIFEQLFKNHLRTSYREKWSKLLKPST